MKDFIGPSCCVYEMALYRTSGCGSVGRSAASNTRDPRFESSHQQILSEAGNGPFKKTIKTVSNLFDKWCQV